jgi:hypothetical protein
VKTGGSQVTRAAVGLTSLSSSLRGAPSITEIENVKSENSARSGGRKFTSHLGKIPQGLRNMASFHFNLTLIKKEIKIFLTYKEIHSGAVAKSYMRKVFLILYMRKCTNIFTIYEEVVCHI